MLTTVLIEFKESTLVNVSWHLYMLTTELTEFNKSTLVNKSWPPHIETTASGELKESTGVAFKWNYLQSTSLHSTVKASGWIGLHQKRHADCKLLVVGHGQVVWSQAGQLADDAFVWHKHGPHCHHRATSVERHSTQVLEKTIFLLTEISFNGNGRWEGDLIIWKSACIFTV